MITVSQSRIKLYKRCPQAFHYKYINNIIPKHSALPLQRGIILHSALEAYYNKKLKKKWREAIGEYQGFWNSLMDEEKELYGGDLLGDCTNIMRRYVKVFPRKREEVHAVELPFEYKLTKQIKLTGVIDLISTDDKGTWITEHKSHKKIPSEDERFLNMQAVLYTVVAEKLGYKIDGIRWNYLRTKLPTVPRTLVNGGLSRAKDIDTDYETLLQAILDNNLSPDDYATELERTKTNEFFVRRYTPSNSTVTNAILEDVIHVATIMEKLSKYPYRNLDTFTCRGCGYKILCQAELMGLDTKFILKKDFKEREDTDKNEAKEEGDE